MSEERERRLLEEGEALAKEAARCGVGAQQLRELFKVFQGHPVAYFEAYVKMQAARGPRVRGFERFAAPLLGMLQGHGGRREEIQSVLGYMNKTFGWEKMSGNPGQTGRTERQQFPTDHRYRARDTTGLPGRHPERTRLGGDAESKIFRMIEPRVEPLGLEGVEAWKEGDAVLVNVRLKRFPRDPRSLDSDLGGIVRNLEEFKNVMVRVWFEAPRR